MTPPSEDRMTEVERRRREIVGIARDLFASRGYRRTRVMDIAAACGVTRPAVHYHFASKRELFQECQRYSVELAVDRQAAALHPAAGPLQRLMHLVDLRLPADDELRAEWRMWLQSWSGAADGVATDHHSAAHRRWHLAVVDVLVEGQEAGVFSCAPADESATQLTSLIDGLGLKVLAGTMGPETIRGHLRRFVARVIVAPRPSESADHAPSIRKKRSSHES